MQNRQYHLTQGEAPPHVEERETQTVTVTQPRLVLCTSVKNLFKPGQADVVIRPSRQTCCVKNLVFLGLYVVYLAGAKSTFCLEDYTGI
jgi:hypothetical protein